MIASGVAVDGMLSIFNVNLKNMSIALFNTRAALVIAHPGHELRVHQWLRLARPLCFVITDGSGRSGKSRLYSTTKILEQTGARAGSIYGRTTDQAIYSAIMNGEFGFFTHLTEELARELVRENIHYVVGDALEGYNPAHDVCRFVINAAVEKANRTTNEAIRNFEIPLTTDPTHYPKALAANAIWLNLDEDAVSKKMEAVQAYAEVADDVEQILAQEGMRALQAEFLRPVSNRFTYDSHISDPPYYETYGEQQVAAGHYNQVIRYREHVLPIAQALQDYSQTHRILHAVNN